MNDVVTAVEEFMKFKEVKAYIDAQSVDIPNFWSIIEYGKNSYETRYSRMIRWLLDTTETHDQGSFFANELIELSSFEGEKKLSAGGGHAKCEALGSNIDIFFIDEQKKITITIELKMWSSDHANNGEHQLDKYYDAVDAKYKPTDDYQNHYFYITINGDSPNVAMMEHREEWDNISYEQILSIVSKMKDEIEQGKARSKKWQDASLKMVEDFYSDMESIRLKYIIQQNQEINKYVDDKISKNKDNLACFKELKKYYIDRKEIDKEKARMFNEAFFRKDSTCLEKKRLIVSLALINLLKKEQEHKANVEVQSVMKEVLYYFVGHKEVDEILNNKNRKKDRKFKIKEALSKEVGFSSIWMTKPKGQGLRFFKEDVEFDHRYKHDHIYFSGDTHGNVLGTFQLKKGNSEGKNINLGSVSVTTLKNLKIETIIASEILKSQQSIDNFIRVITEVLPQTSKYFEYYGAGKNIPEEVLQIVNESSLKNSPR